jgi:apolipoprotein N-acyltransferase
MVVMAGPLSRRGAMVMGWALGVGYFAVSLHWIVEPFLVDVPRYGWMAPFGLVFMALGAGLFWALGAVLAQGIGRGVVTPAGLAMGLLVAEITRALIFTGFPWAMIGHVWIDTPIAYVAAVVGPHGLTAVALALAALLARGRAVPISMALVPLAVVLFAQTLVTPMEPDEGAPLVRIIQPNAPQHLKWAPGHAEMFFERQVTMTGEAGTGEAGAPDVVIWPETSVPYFLDVAEGALAYVAEAAGGAPVVLGGLHREGPAYFNTLAVVGQNGSMIDRYQKSHLVPFGEYIPWGDTLARLGLSFGVVRPGEGYQSGAGLHLVDVPGIGSVMPLICYEGIFAEEVNAVQGRARAIVLITNDAWFGNWAGPAQHFAQARLRAIEQGLPVIRAANTGISGMIDATGRVVADIALNTQGYVDVPLPRALSAPLYTVWGDWPVIVLVILFGVGQSVTARRKGVDPAGAPS